METTKRFNISRFSIPQSKINELNKLLSVPDDLDSFFKRLEKLLLNWRKIYQKYGTSPEKKEKIIIFIINEIIKLSKNLNVRMVYNSSAGIHIDHYKYKNLTQLKTLYRIKWHNILQYPVKWATCNIVVYYFYWLIKEITKNDSKVEYFFELGQKDNHWKIIIKIGKNSYTLESSELWLIFKKYKRWKNTIIYSNVNQYVKESMIWQLKLNKIAYRYGQYSLKLFNLKWIKLFSFHTKPIKKLNIQWLKRLSKYAQTIVKIRPLFKIQNYDQIRKQIIMYNLKDKEIINEIFKQLDETFLDNFIKKN